MTLVAPEQTLTKSDLPYFHEMDPIEQDLLWQAAKPHFEEELAFFSEHPRYTDLDTVAADIRRGILEPLYEVHGSFGIARPVRDRYDLSQCRTDDELSVPYLHRDAIVVVNDLASDFQGVVRHDDEFMDALRREDLVAIRLSVYSLLRLTRYQRFIASQGRFAIGRMDDGIDRPSTHKKARALDIDHAGFYALRVTGEEVTFNRDSNDRDFASLARLLPQFRALLRNTVTAYQEDSTIMALEEVPRGWGGWHIAVKAAA